MLPSLEVIRWFAAMVRAVRLSNCHMLISPKLIETDIWLLENRNRNPRFAIQNLPPDSRSEVRFRHFMSVSQSALRPL